MALFTIDNEKTLLYTWHSQLRQMIHMPTNFLIGATNINNMLNNIIHGSDKSEDMKNPYMTPQFSG